MDKELEERIINGDISAFEKVYAEFFNCVVFFVSQYIPNSEDARDIAQDTFLTLWRQHAKYNREYKISTFIFTIARNKSIDYLRNQLLKHKHKQSIQKREAQVNYMALLDQSAEQLMQLEVDELYKKTLKSLPDKQQMVFKMSRNEGFSYEEIAVNLDISVKTVEYRMMQALRKLRIAFKDYLEVICIGIMLLINQ